MKSQLLKETKSPEKASKYLDEILQSKSIPEAPKQIMTVELYYQKHLNNDNQTH